MILLALRGENFRKFHRLRLENIPRRGLLGVRGANEAGKSTVGELIQFALFGKTQQTPHGSVLDLIHWSGDHCTVELDFETGEGEACARYRIRRELDRYGTHFARLTGIDDGREHAAGLTQVQERLRELVRFDFEDFHHSFYLAEGEAPRSPEQLRAFLDRIVGVNVLLGVKEQVRSELDDLEDSFARVQSEAKRNRMQIEKYQPNIASIPELEGVCAEHAHAIQELQEQERSLEQRVAAVEAQAKEREKQRDRLRAVAAMSGAGAAPAIERLRDYYEKEQPGAGGAGGRNLERIRTGLRALMPLVSAYVRVGRAVENELTELRALFESTSEGSFLAREQRQRDMKARAHEGRNFRIVAAVLLALGCAVAIVFQLVDLQGAGSISSALAPAKPELFRLAAVSLTLALALGTFYFAMSARQLRIAMRQADRELARLEVAGGSERENLEGLKRFVSGDPPLDDVIHVLGLCSRPQVAIALEEFRTQLLAAVTEGDSVRSKIYALGEEEQQWSQELRAHIKESRKELQRLGEQQRRESSKRDRTESEIREFQKQDAKREQLEQLNEGLERQAQSVQVEIDTRYLLLKLLDETVDSIRMRAGPNLGRVMRRLLPSLTDDRYSDLQVSPDFHLRIYTSMKSDFLAPHELSGGTYEGIAFGFRLVFSQAFIKAVTHASQFLFLDEPFKAMDRQRVHRTLGLLMRLSPELAQVFVVSPEISADDRALFDHMLELRIGRTELLYDFGTGAAPAVVPLAPSALARAPEALTPEGPALAAIPEAGLEPAPVALPDAAVEPPALPFDLTPTDAPTERGSEGAPTETRREA